MEKSEWIWMNGEFVPWDNANIHVLSHGLGRPADADRVEAAVASALDRGLRTPDLAGPGGVEVDTEEMTAAVLEELHALH